MKKKQKKMIYHRHRNPFIRKPTKKIATKRRKTTTTKPINSEERQRPRFVTFTVTDFDATDSSSSDEDERGNVAEIRKRKVKVFRIDMGQSDHRPPAPLVNPGGQSKFRGVRRRLSGNWAAEIRNSKLQTRVWLGTYDTAEEAAIAYDIEAIRIRGPNARTNLLKPPPPSDSRDPSPSPKSVLMLSPIDHTSQSENNISKHPQNDDEKVRDSARSGNDDDHHQEQKKSGNNEEEDLSREFGDHRRQKPFDINFLSKYIGELTPPPPPLIYFYGNNMVKEELRACW